MKEIWLLFLTGCAVSSSTEPRETSPPSETPTPAPTPTIFAMQPITVYRDPSSTLVNSTVGLYWTAVPFHSISFSLTLSPTCYGADAYTNIYVNGGLWAQLGINGFDHWQRSACNPPNTSDFRFFIGLAGAGGWINDVMIQYPVSKLYSSPTAFTIKSDSGRIRFYEEGVEITYRDVGNVFPAGSFDNTAGVFPAALNNIGLTLAVLGDGTDTEPCGTYVSPFIPGSGSLTASATWSNIQID